MENKLTLEHLSPYLPYGLKINEGGIDRELTGLKLTNDGTIIVNYNYLIWVLIGNFKPILRPLSDLTKEIEVDGEKFVPLNKLRLDFDLDFDAEERSFVSMFEILEDYNQLLKWHFDINELIEKGLAIDINQLNK
jgi:hypothetical protein